MGVPQTGASPFDEFGFEPGPERVRDSVPPHVLNTLPWMIASVALTAVCCAPAGVVGLYFVDRANNLARFGKLDEARERLLYAQIAVIAGSILSVIAITVGVLIVMASE